MATWCRKGTHQYQEDAATTVVTYEEIITWKAQLSASIYCLCVVVPGNSGSF